MAWSEPIYDRTLTDIVNHTDKAFWNIADWIRVNSNTQYVRAIIGVLRAVNLSFASVTEPVITTVPLASEINAFVDNLEKLRIASGLPLTVGLIELKTDYLSGASAKAPDYEEVNNWERNLNLLKRLLLDSSSYEVFCGVSEVGQIRFWQNRFRVPWVPAIDSPTRKAKSGIAICGTNRKRQNKFRRYS